MNNLLKSLPLVGNVLIYLIALGLLSSSFAKLLSMKSVIESLMKINMNEPVILGVLELTCTILVSIPMTRNLGFNMCTAYLGGVIVAENAMGFSPKTGITLITILWLGKFLSDPEFFGFSPFYKKTE